MLSDSNLESLSIDKINFLYYNDIHIEIHQGVSMRTNIVIDDTLLKEAVKYTNLKTKKEIIHLALQELVNNYKKKSLLDLKGDISFEKGYDYKKLRVDTCT